MLTFLDFIVESAVKDDPKVEGAVSNNTNGTLHEILTGYHLNGGQHMKSYRNEKGETPEQAHDRLKSQIHPKDYERINQRAKSTAEHIRQQLKKTHPDHEIIGVHHTSKPGDTEAVTGVKASQKEDPSDIYITTANKNNKKDVVHHGKSLKVTEGSNKKVPASSLGAEFSGSQAKAIHAKHREDLYAAHPELKGIKNKQKRKDWMKSNPQAASDIRGRNRRLLNDVATAHAKELNDRLAKGDHEGVVSHIRQVLHAHPTPAQSAGRATFEKVTTTRTAKGPQHHSEDSSSKYESILSDPKNITVQSKGSSVHFFYKGKKFATQAHKLDSQSDPLSSLKSAGREA
jgi:hypothetical protein